MKRFDPKNKYLGWGITAFAVIACCILFYMLLQHGKSIGDAISSLLGILSPIIWGLVIAYLLWPLTRVFQRKLFEPLLNRIRPKKPVRTSLARADYYCRPHLAHYPADLYERGEHCAQLSGVL